MKEQLLDNSYKLLEELGKGGFGAVFKAVRVGSEGAGPIAIKLLHHNPGLKFTEYVRFQREATLMSQLVHPNIVAVYELGEHLGSYFIAMEYVEGKNLREFVNQKGGKIQLNQIIEILIQAAEGLEYVHGHQITHRDIKPQNLLIKEIQDSKQQNLQVKIVDFGVARLGYSVQNGADTNLAEKAEVVGTYAYMPPESTGLMDWFPDHRSDVYSLGVVAFDLIAGKPPFHQIRGEDLRNAHAFLDPPPMSSVLNSPVAPILEAIVAKCLQKKPDDRYQSMFALICDLKRVQEDINKREPLKEFPVASKDMGFGKHLKKLYIDKGKTFEKITGIVSKEPKQKSRLTWTMIKGEVGTGKTRCMEELRRKLETLDCRYLYLRFSESEQRLPFQSLTLAINDYLSYFERFNPAGYRYFVDSVTRDLGEGAPELARLIPILRPILKDSLFLKPGLLTKTSPIQPTRISDEVNFIENFDRRYAAPNARINQSFVALFNSMVGLDSHLVFLMDDIHLADSSTLALFQFMTEQVNGIVNYGFVFTMRSRTPKANFVLENFVNRLRLLKRRFNAFELKPFENSELEDFFSHLGLREISPAFLEFVASTTKGYPLRVHSLVKQMLAQNIIKLVSIPQALNGLAYIVKVEEGTWNQCIFESNNIEFLIASLEHLGENNRYLLDIVAVSQGPVPYQLFDVEPGLSKIELDNRLKSLVNQGILDASGDEDMPFHKKEFAFAHEKIRNSIWNQLEPEKRKALHWKIAVTIDKIFKTHKKEYVLALAKHCDGASELAKPEICIPAFIKAAKTYVDSKDLNFAHYFITRAELKLKSVPEGTHRISYLQSILEVRYFYHASQSQMVEAAQCCVALAEIVKDPKYRMSTYLYLTQIYTGLGQTKDALASAHLAMKEQHSPTWTQSSFLNLFFRTYTFWNYFSYIYKFTSKLFPITPKFQNQSHVGLETFGILNAIQGNNLLPHEWIWVLMRLRLDKTIGAKWILANHAILLCLASRQGNFAKSYSQFMELFQTCEKSGHSDTLRWLRVLKAIWFDYPTSNIGALKSAIDNPRGTQLPLDGVLSLESHTVSSIFNLLHWQNKGSNEGVVTDPKLNRKAKKSVSSAFGNLTLNIIVGRRGFKKTVTETSDLNGCLGLYYFCESLKSALSDKTEALRIYSDQVKKKQSGSGLGEIFKDHTLSLYQLFIGKHKESLDLYMSIKPRLVTPKDHFLDPIAIDGIILGFIFLPIAAAAFKAQGWAWGSGLKPMGIAIQKYVNLMHPDPQTPRSITSTFFLAYLEFQLGERVKSVQKMLHCAKSAHIQKQYFLECLIRMILGVHYAQLKQKKSAQDQFTSCVQLAIKMSWPGLERIVLSLSKRTMSALNVAPIFGGPNQINNKIKESDFSIFPYLQNLSETKELMPLIQQAMDMALMMFRPKEVIVFLAGEVPKDTQFKPLASKQLSESHPVPQDRRKSHTDLQSYQRLTKWMSHSPDEPVKIIPLSDINEGLLSSKPQNSDDRPQTSQNLPSKKTGPMKPDIEEATVGIKASAPQDDEATQHLTSPEGNGEDPTTISPVVKSPIADRRQDDSEFVVLCAISHKEEVLGWMVLSQVSSRVYSSVDLEQDLILTGLHLGHLIKKLRMDREHSMSKFSLPSLIPDSQHPLPPGMRLDVLGEASTVSILQGSLVQPISSRLLIASSWNFLANTELAHNNEELVLEFVPKLTRHLEFFAKSASQSSDFRRFEIICDSFKKDINSLIKKHVHHSMFKRFDLAITLIHCIQNCSFEIVFGNEMFGFHGICSVEKEEVHDLGPLISRGRLVVRHKVRYFNGYSGWLFGQNEATTQLLPEFATTDFLEKFQENPSMGLLPLHPVKISELAGFIITYDAAKQQGDLALLGA